MRGPSLYGDERACIICGSPYVHLHHIYGGSGRRSVSDREGCWAYLCPAHHNMSSSGVHFDRDLDLRLKEDCERRWCDRNGKTKDDFRAVFGINYL